MAFQEIICLAITNDVVLCFIGNINQSYQISINHIKYQSIISNINQSIISNINLSYQISINYRRNIKAIILELRSSNIFWDYDHICTEDLKQE